jgi:hypothetical protein
VAIKPNGDAKGQGSSATNVTSAGSKVQGSFTFVVSKGKGSFSTTNVTCQGYAPAETRPPGTTLPPSSLYNTMHQELGLYNPNTHSDPRNKFFEVMKRQKMSAMSAPAQQAKSCPTTSKIDSYKEDGEVYNREKLGLRPNDPIFMKHDVPENFEFGKPFLTSAELSKRHFPLMRLHNWYLIASSLGVTNIIFQIPGKAFYSGARIGSIEFEDFWLMFHRKSLDMNLLVIWCL